jgi:hypothetical protein
MDGQQILTRTSAQATKAYESVLPLKASFMQWSRPSVAWNPALLASCKMCAIRLPVSQNGQAMHGLPHQVPVSVHVRHCQQALHDSHIRPKINGSLK